MRSCIFYLLFFTCFFYSQKSAGQSVASPKGWFEVSFVKGCAPLEVEVTYTDDRPAETVRKIRYTENSQYLNDLSHTYNSPGSYVVEMLIEGEGGNSAETDALVVEVLPAPEPVFKAGNCGNNTLAVQVLPEDQEYTYDYYLVTAGSGSLFRADASNNYMVIHSGISPGLTDILVEGRYEGTGVAFNCASSAAQVQVTSSPLEAAKINNLTASLTNNVATLNYSLQPGVSQILEVEENGSGNFETYNAALTGNEITLDNLDLKNNFYCFRIRTENLCDPGQLIYSETICTADISGSTTAGGNTVEFRTGSYGQVETLILRDNQEINSSGAGPSGSFTDTDINCNTPYRYAIRLEYPAAESLTEGISLTNPNGGTLTRPEVIASTWEEDHILFKILLDKIPDQATFQVYNAEGSSPALVLRSDSNVLELPVAGEQNCYRFSYTDDCGNESELSQPVCAIYVKNVSTSPGEIVLEWNEYTGYKNGVRSYVVYEYNPEGNFERTYPVGTQTSLNLGELPQEKEGTRFYVNAIPFVVDATDESNSNPYEFDIPMEGFFPNAFTPNQDERNDFFKAEGIFVEGGELEIYSRWGNIIFKTTDLLQGWDGTIGGQPAPQGVYVYKALIRTKDGGQQSKEGTVFLMRP